MGRAAESAFATFESYEQIETNLVLGENVAQALQFVSSGSARCRHHRFVFGIGSEEAGPPRALLASR